ncbi:MAG: VOC family protein [Cellvibrionaceae bacterium]|uniref:VOC family protein n=1 Tax=uncultured Pseudoteredinibacter sp. TaxID=1641701 RepID=UPI0026359FB8|nr:VOC family protein [uncultured Pseudoteredinibacter sp.]MCV6622140.1 VOC family protein [Cellvibrionaceae bacterium]
MIGYVTLGTNDFAKAADFYDALLGSIGANRFMDMDTFVAWAVDPGKPMICISKPFDGNEATVGNGSMTAVAMDTQDKVDAFHQKAMDLGASDEGAPGLRGDGFYGAYFRDLDGNKLCAFTIVS